MALTPRRKGIICLLAAYWPALFVMAHIPVPEVVREAGISDKSLHFLAYLGLVLLLWGALRPDQRVDWRKGTVWWVLAAMAGYGLIDEWLQGFVGGRSPDPRDFLADMAGAVTSLALLSILDFPLAAMLITAGTLFTLDGLTRADLTRLVPFANDLLHFLGYGAFTVLCLLHRPLFRPAGSDRCRPGMWYALTVPLALLTCIKLMAWALGKRPSGLEIAMAVAGVLVALGTSGLLTLRSRPPTGPSEA